jgi:hypothetical protein
MITDGDETNSQWFWELLSTSQRSLRNLSSKLEKLSKADLQQYYLIYEDAKSSINPCYREEYDPFLEDDFMCSEDHGDDFAAWAVMQGLDFYTQVRDQPNHIQQFLNEFEESLVLDSEGHWDMEVDREQYKGYARPDYIASAVYGLLFKEDLHEACFDASGLPKV